MKHLGDAPRKCISANVEVSQHAQLTSIEEVGEALIPGLVQCVVPGLLPRDLHASFLLWMRK